MSDTDLTPEIDFDHLNQYVAGDAALTAEIFEMFTHQVEMWGRALVVEADDETWASVTHSLKGSARAIGAVQLAGLCETAETLTGERNRVGLREISIQNIEFRASRVIAEIQRWEHRNMIRKIKGTQ